MKRKKVRNQTSYELLAWLEARLSTQDLVVAREMLAAAEASAELPFRRLLWLYHGHDQVEGTYGQMICSARLRMADIKTGPEAGPDAQMARALSFAARTADFKDAQPETLALHMKGARPRAVILGAMVEGPDPVEGHHPRASWASPIRAKNETGARRGSAPREGPALPKERSLCGRIGAYTMLARNDPRETTKAAREAFADKFGREVDPQGLLEPGERARRAEMARKAHYARMSLISAQRRRKP